MPEILQIIRGRDEPGRWWYVLTPMTSRVIPATHVVASGERYAELAAVIGALRAKRTPVLLYVAEPGWFGSPADVLAALTSEDQATLVEALGATSVDVRPLTPPAPR